MRLLWQKHLTLFILISCCFIVGSVYLYEASASKQFPITLVTTHGDENILHDIEVNGIITDIYHKTTFTWQQKQTNAQLTPYAKPNPFYYVYPNGYQSEHYFIELWRESYSTQLYSAMSDLETNNRYNFSAVSFPISFVLTEQEYLRTNDEHYGATITNDTGYFTTVTSGADRGTNIIYKINYPDSKDFYSNEKQKAEQIATFSLDTTDTDDQSNASYLAVLGLESMGEYLYVIGLERHNELVIKQYTLAGELVETDYTDLTPYVEQNYFRQSYDGNYKAFFHHEEQQFTISFVHKNRDQQLFVTIDQRTSAADHPRITTNISHLIETDNNYEIYTFQDTNIQDALLIDNRLYYIATMFEQGENDRISDLAPMRLMLQIVENNNTIYTGHLQTAVDDDKLRWYNQSLDKRIEDTIVYGSLDFRKVQKLRLSPLLRKEHP